MQDIKIREHTKLKVDLPETSKRLLHQQAFSPKLALLSEYSSSSKNLTLNQEKRLWMWISPLSSQTPGRKPPSSPLIFPKSTLVLSACFSLSVKLSSSAAPGTSSFPKLSAIPHHAPLVLSPRHLHAAGSPQKYLITAWRIILQVSPPGLPLKSTTWSFNSLSRGTTRPPKATPPGKICYNNYLLKWGSTNMPLFGRVHECKKCEHWSEKQVWIVSAMKWTLPKNQGDPHGDTSEIPTHSG